jgi:hypothetical protein
LSRETHGLSHRFQSWQGSSTGTFFEKSARWSKRSGKSTSGTGSWFVDTSSGWRRTPGCLCCLLELPGTEAGRCVTLGNRTRSRAEYPRPGTVILAGGATRDQERHISNAERVVESRGPSDTRGCLWARRTCVDADERGIFLRAGGPARPNSPASSARRRLSLPRRPRGAWAAVRECRPTPGATPQRRGWNPGTSSPAAP